MVGGRFVTEEYVPGWRFYVVFAVLLVASLALGIYVASLSEWEEVAGPAGPAVWLWLLGAILAGFVAPDLAQYATLRRFGMRPRRVRWTERNNSPLFAWWRAPEHRFTQAQFAVSYGVPVLLSFLVVLVYVIRFPTAAPILGLVLPFYLGNLWFALLVLHKPGGTLVEPLGRGVRFHEPLVRASSA